MYLIAHFTGVMKLFLAHCKNYKYALLHDIKYLEAQLIH